MTRAPTFEALDCSPQLQLFSPLAAVTEGFSDDNCRELPQPLAAELLNWRPFQDEAASGAERERVDRERAEEEAYQAAALAAEEAAAAEAERASAALAAEAASAAAAAEAAANAAMLLRIVGEEETSRNGLLTAEAEAHGALTLAADVSAEAASGAERERVDRERAEEEAYQAAALAAEEAAAAEAERASAALAAEAASAAAAAEAAANAAMLLRIVGEEETSRNGLLTAEAEAHGALTLAADVSAEAASGAEREPVGGQRDASGSALSSFAPHTLPSSCFPDSRVATAHPNPLLLAAEVLLASSGRIAASLSSDQRLAARILAARCVTTTFRHCAIVATSELVGCVPPAALLVSCGLVLAARGFSMLFQSPLLTPALTAIVAEHSAEEAASALSSACVVLPVIGAISMLAADLESELETDPPVSENVFEYFSRALEIVGCLET